ncbi:MAG: hypothetical protein AVDCRST_MAG49-567 [uncultured Thermomicrobiales bacterium]|uniref:Uncharacterized protein n=1 Tax=uncultured Thermomicrobiales bacterium TaxID=1645740 RepID=A0A6J4U257_9BACT|nr:MAG: hypothetical protein AVDCRST_MAG49-567 [uncultured Thermomicrobiales bacterium]
MATEERIGEGTLYDTDDVELGDVAYRIVTGQGDDGRLWSGELAFAGEDLTLEPGLYVLATEDGTQSDIEVEPAGAARGDARQFAFLGVGTFGVRTM